MNPFDIIVLVAVICTGSSTIDGDCNTVIYQQFEDRARCYTHLERNIGEATPTRQYYCVTQSEAEVMMASTR